MALIVDTMIEEEVCLNLRLDKDCLVISIDRNADVIDCKEFFEEFYHLATGFNYDTDTGIPDDETEAEMYLTRLQEEFDEKMKSITLGISICQETMIQTQLMPKNKLNIKNKMRSMDDENFPVQCHPILKFKKKKSEEVKIETV